MKWSKSLCRIVAIGALISRALSRTIKPIVYSYSSWSNEDKKDTPTFVDSDTNLYPTYERPISPKKAEKSPSEPVVTNVTASTEYVFVYKPRLRANHRFKSEGDRLNKTQNFKHVKVLRKPVKYTITSEKSYPEKLTTTATRLDVTSFRPSLNVTKKTRFAIKSRLGVSKSRNEIPVNEEGSKEESAQHTDSKPNKYNSYSSNRDINFIPPEEPDLSDLSSKLYNLNVESAVAINNAIMPPSGQDCDWCTRDSKNVTQYPLKSSRFRNEPKRRRISTTTMTRTTTTTTTTTPNYDYVETTLPISENFEEPKPVIIGGKYQRQKNILQTELKEEANEDRNEETQVLPFDEETEQETENPIAQTKILQYPLKYYYSSDQKPASSGNNKESQKKEDENHKKGGGEQHKAEFHENEGKKHDEGYKSHKVYDHGSKGHEKNEDRKKVHQEKKGKKKSEHEEDSHYNEKHKAIKGEKEAEYAEEGKHKKGHSTKGSHNVHKKNEFLKKHEFYDEHHEADDHKKYKDFETGYKQEKAGKHKKAHRDKNYSNDHKAKKGHKKKGTRIYEDKGHKKEHGGKNKHDFEEDYEEDGHDYKKSKWMYEKD